MSKGKNYSMDFESVLMKCLDSVAEGKLSASECLRQYPQYAASLEPLLRNAEALRHLRIIRPSLGFRKQATARLQRRIAASSRAPRPARKQAASSRWFSSGMPRFALRGLVALVIVAALASFSGIAAYASDGAVPGDPLYGLDTGVEQVQLKLASDPQQALDLQLQFAQERLSEAEALLSEGDGENLQTALALYDQSVKSITTSAEQVALEDQKLAAQQVEESLSVNQARLEELLTQVPEQARPGIERAIEASNEGRHGDNSENAQAQHPFDGQVNAGAALPGNRLGATKQRGNPHQAEEGSVEEPTNSLRGQGNGRTTGGQPDNRPGQGGGNNGGNNRGNGSNNGNGHSNGGGGGRPDDTPGQGDNNGNGNGNGRPGDGND